MSILDTHSTVVGTPPDAVPSAAFEVVLSDGTHELVRGADAYQQEQSMTTFFRTDGRRHRLDCWSVRVASFRTDQLLAVRRVTSVDDHPHRLRSI